jgi:pimeloyl-ACP methyl ester carboxylesterase
MFSSTPRNLLALSVTLCVTALANASAPVEVESTEQKEKKGVVFIVGGVGGFDIIGAASQWELPRSGVRHEIRDFVWTHGWGQFLRDLQDRPHMLQKGEELAEEVKKFRKDNPCRPVYLVGKSGGAGVVLAAAELLPEASVERIILLSAAVSPNHDLRPAFRAARAEVVSFHSPYDQMILGWGTSYFGTIDRIYGPSAGLHGFNVPGYLSPEDRALYDRLVQVPWNTNMILEGHFGNHVGSSFPGFVGQEVAPWLKDNPKTNGASSK